MTVLLKLFYAGAVMALLIISVAFGIRTFYGAPERPEPPRFPAPAAVRPAPTPAAEEGTFEREQRLYQEAHEEYEEALARYRRNVLFLSTLLGVAAVVSGTALAPVLDALRLGLVGGGLGTIIYGVAQAGPDLDEIGPAAVFAVTAIGLLLVVAAGYRWQARRPAE
jgi:hypothetical protein